MATVKEIKRKKGNAYQIAFVKDGKRVYLSLGSKYEKADAYEIARVVERLVRARTTGAALDKRAESWLNAAPEDLLERLERAGLIEREKTPTLGELFDAYRDAEFDDLKETSRRVKERSFRTFFSLVSPETTLDAFTRRVAALFSTNLARGHRYSEATRATIIRDVRRVFGWALEMDLIEKNPFRGVRGGSYMNKEREFYVSLEDYEKMLDACPSQDWRALLALYRIGGLRFSEAFELTWRGVDFGGRRLLVHSTKTERFAGKGERVVPMFPRLFKELDALWETDAGTSEKLITISRSGARNRFAHIVFRAGLTPWERLFQNLRSSAAIDVARKFGEIAENAWIGHSLQTARNHYLHVIDADFERAVADPKNDLKNDPARGEDSKRFAV